MFGGQSIQDFDRAMALGVRRTFKKEFIRSIKEVLNFLDVNDQISEDVTTKLKEFENLPTYLNESNFDKTKEELNKLLKEYNVSIDTDFVVRKSYKNACKRTEDETYQAMESVIFNLNSMHSRVFAQNIYV